MTSPSISAVSPALRTGSPAVWANFYALGVFLFLLSFSSPTVAAKRVAVLSFSGPAGAQSATFLRQQLASRTKTVPASAFRNANSRAGITASAEALGVAGVVRGSIEQLGTRWVLKAQLWDGTSGRVVASQTFPLRSSRLTPVDSKPIVQWVMQNLGKTHAVGGAADNEPAVASHSSTKSSTPTVRVEEVPVTNPQEPTVQPTPPITPTPPSSNSYLDDDEDEDEDNNDDVTSDDTEQPEKKSLGFNVAKSTPPKTTHTDDITSRSSDFTESDSEKLRHAWRPIIRLAVGDVLLNRSFRFNQPRNPVTVPDYATPGAYPLVPYLEAAIFPFSALTKGAWAGLALDVRYFRSFGLKSKFQGYTTSQDTTTQLVDVGLRYNWNLFNKPSSVAFNFAAQFGLHQFTITIPDESQRDLPNIEYQYIKLGPVGVEVPFVVRRTFMIGFIADFSYLLVLKSGPIEADAPSGYGKSRTNGFDLEGGLYAHFGYFFARASGFYRLYWYDFDSNNCKNACRSAGGAYDSYAGAILRVGFSY